ncbi:MAG: quinolinate synthase NadA [Lysobacterales bacterium]|nr:MAG: quinolinate synthase NadA [Xanthomonadales bacterium]
MQAEAIYQDLRRKLGDVMPEAELLLKAEVAAEVLALKAERDAVILGHNYMEPALFHTVPDFRGDSLELSRRAAETDKPVIVFCGVRFMAETAKILNPGKTVLLPTERGGCSLAESITAADVRALRAAYPGVPIVTYINTYADVKAECDICCTSSNAVAVVESLKTDTVIFLPDEYLAKNVARETGCHVIVPSVLPKPGAGARPGTDVERTMIAWKGRCEVHELFTPEDIDSVRSQFPDVMILAHPECSPEVVAKADYSGSTTAMIKAVEQSKAKRFLLLTECSMGDNIVAANPEKEMLRLCSHRCPHMHEITLEQTRDSLKYLRWVIDVPEDVRIRALRSVERMLAIGPKID